MYCLFLENRLDSDFIKALGFVIAITREQEKMEGCVWRVGIRHT